jgi:haloalkane dehalogenase
VTKCVALPVNIHESAPQYPENGVSQQMDRRIFLRASMGGALIGTAPIRAYPQSPAGDNSTKGDAIDVAAFHASRRYAELPFGRIAYVERGSGPAALFVHGLPLNGFQWRGALQRLASIRRCIAPDSMGLGYSEIPDGQDLSPHEQANMLIAFLDKLKIPSVDLVGSDSGGAIAQILVAQHPKRVRSLLLTNCDAPQDSPPPALLPVISASRAGTFADDVLVPELRDKSIARLSSGLGGCCYTDPVRFSDETIECYLAPLVSSPRRKDQLHRYCLGLERNPLADVEPALRAYQAPVRIVWGTGDTLFSQASPDWFARVFPNFLGTRRVAGAKLFFPEEMPDLIADEARALWKHG